MNSCRQCGQLLAAGARSCPACGEPVADGPPTREEAPTAEDVHDPEAAADDLLAAVTVDDDEPARTRPPWVAPLSERMRPGPEASSRRDRGDLLPGEPPPRRRRWAFWRR